MTYTECNPKTLTSLDQMKLKKSASNLAKSSDKCQMRNNYHHNECQQHNHHFAKRQLYSHLPSKCQCLSSNTL